MAMPINCTVIITKTPPRFDLKYNINFTNIFLFINNRWITKVLQAFLIVSLYSTGDYLLKFLDNKRTLTFLQTFLLNFALFAGFYLFFFGCAMCLQLEFRSLV